jgi:hypothetical protein
VRRRGTCGANRGLAHARKFVVFSHQGFCPRNPYQRLFQSNVRLLDQRSRTSDLGMLPGINSTRHRMTITKHQGLALT